MIMRNAGIGKRGDRKKEGKKRKKVGKIDRNVQNVSGPDSKTEGN